MKAAIKRQLLTYCETPLVHCLAAEVLVSFHNSTIQSHGESIFHAVLYLAENLICQIELKMRVQ